MARTHALQLAVELLLQRYFDGLYSCDIETLREVFHPRAIYVCVTGDDLSYLTMKEYLPIVESRVPPAARGERRRDAIETITFAGDKAAAARVHCSVGQRYFTDLLTLILDGGRWQIVSKVFHYDLIGPERS